MAWATEIFSINVNLARATDIFSINVNLARAAEIITITGYRQNFKTTGCRQWG